MFLILKHQMQVSICTGYLEVEFLFRVLFKGKKPIKMDGCSICLIVLQRCCSPEHFQAQLRVAYFVLGMNTLFLFVEI